MGFLKPKQAKTPANQFSDFIKNSYSGVVEQGNKATNFLSGLLTGGAGNEEATAAFDRYKDQAGFAPALRQLSQRITGQGAASGILNSGPTARRLNQQGAEINQGMFSNFLQQLSGLSGLGMNAGQMISGAGGQQIQQQPSTASRIFSAIGSIGSIFSDRAAKRDIEKLTEFPDGLGVYKFKYLGDDEERIGVMADEVARIRPWALGPMAGPFQTVNYAAL